MTKTRSGSPKVWKIAPGREASHWDVCWEKGCIAIGWLSKDDLAQFDGEQAIFKALKRRGETPSTKAINMILAFRDDVRQGDIIIANDGLSKVVGIGRVVSGYLSPKSRLNPMRHEDEYTQVRRVEWLIKDMVELGKRCFRQDTVYALNDQVCRIVRKAYERQNARLERPLRKLFDAEYAKNHLGPADDEGETDTASPYRASPIDQRQANNRLILQRRGQQAFRRGLLRRYRSRCCVTACGTIDVLEAAHIDPYRGKDHNHLDNGLLLRADIHTLFDLDLLGIDPATLQIQLHPLLAGQYKKLSGTKLRVPDGGGPSRAALKRRMKRFIEKKANCS